jgi:biopolymer transport protein ExbB
MSHRQRWILPALAVLALALCSPQLAAQEGEVHKKTMMELFEATGLVGWLLVLCSVAGTGLVIEHIMNLRQSKLAPEDVSEELNALIEEENYDEALALCEEQPNYLTNVINSALQMRHAGYEEMIGGLESSAAAETLKLNTKISYLSLIGNIAPLLGLLGTVTGMISSFQVIETLKAPTPRDLAVGVYESLVNTTMGLFVALLFLSAYFVFKNNVSKMSVSINLRAVDMLKHLAGQHGHHQVTAK